MIYPLHCSRKQASFDFMADHHTHWFWDCGPTTTAVPVLPQVFAEMPWIGTVKVLCKLVEKLCRNGICSVMSQLLCPHGLCSYRLLCHGFFSGWQMGGFVFLLRIFNLGWIWISTWNSRTGGFTVWAAAKSGKLIGTLWNKKIKWMIMLHPAVYLSFHRTFISLCWWHLWRWNWKQGFFSFFSFCVISLSFCIFS